MAKFIAGIEEEDEDMIEEEEEEQETDFVLNSPMDAQNKYAVTPRREFGSEDFFGQPAVIQRLNSDEVIYRPNKKEPKMIGKYLFADKLGEGSYGKVKEALDSVTCKRVAVKIMKNKKLRKIPCGQDNVKKEIKLLRVLKHSNVIKLLDVLYNAKKEKIYLFMEYCAGNLQEMLDFAPLHKFPIWQAHDYFFQLLCGIEYIHSQGVIHRDIKPGNLLLQSDGCLKISDFGVAEILDLFANIDICTTSAGSPAFQPPEIANGAEYFSGYKLDMWAAGVTLWNFVTGGYPFEGETIFALYAAIGKGTFIMPDLEVGLCDILENLLHFESGQRFDVQQALNHPWIVQQPEISDDDYDEAVPIPPGEQNNELRGTTALPFLETMYGEVQPFDVRTKSEDQSSLHSFGESSNTSPHREKRIGLRRFFTSIFKGKERTRRDSV